MDSDQHVTETESTLINLYNVSDVKDEKPVLVKVLGRGNEPDPVFYLMGRKMPFRQLMISYTRRIGVSFNSLKFLLNGKDIYPRQSASCLKLEDIVSIDVVRRCDQYIAPAGTESALICLPRSQGEKPIYLQVQPHSQMKYGKNFYYLIGRNTPLEILLFDYADRVFEIHRRFYLTHDDKGAIDLKNTAVDLGFDDGEILFMFLINNM